MSAVSKKQQKFFGIVRSVQKGEQSPTTPEVAKAASSMKKSDVKKFASTKHKGLPMKKESYYNWRDELELEEGNPLQKAWNWFVPHPSKSANPKVRSGEYQPPSSAKPGLNLMNKSAENINKPIKAISKGLKTVKKVGKFVSKNPGKAALIGAGVVGAGLLAKKALSRKKKKKKKKKNLKEQTTFPQMQQRIRDAKERRREQQKQSEKLYMDTKKKGVKFYDKQGTGRLKDGKKVYD